jgi:hypothetical protein
MNTNVVSINIQKAQAIVHEARRAARSAEFAPLDIKATIPSEAAAAEAARQEVRERYETMQVSIDTATEVTALKAIMETL